MLQAQASTLAQSLRDSSACRYTREVFSGTLFLQHRFVILYSRQVADTSLLLMREAEDC